MNTLKRILGLCWLVAGPLVVILLVAGAINFIDTEGTKDINNPVIWVIILFIFIPIALGLTLFGWYALRGEYDRLPSDSTQL